MFQTLPLKPNHKVNYFEKLYYRLLTQSRVKTLLDFTKMLSTSCNLHREVIMTLLQVSE